jgi:hypothetical protein
MPRLCYAIEWTPYKINIREPTDSISKHGPTDLRKDASTRFPARWRPIFKEIQPKIIYESRNFTNTYVLPVYWNQVQFAKNTSGKQSAAATQIYNYVHTRIYKKRSTTLSSDLWFPKSHKDSGETATTPGPLVVYQRSTMFRTTRLPF